MAVASERGRARAENQDAAFVARDGGLLLVCDGLGGQRGGGVAARLVVGLLPALLERVGAATPGYPVDAGVTRGVIRRAVLAVNAEVRALGAHNPDPTAWGRPSPSSSWAARAPTSLTWAIAGCTCCGGQACAG